MSKNKSIYLALGLLTGLLASTNAAAKEHKVKSDGNQAKVVAHISFAGLTPLNMAMQKHGDDKYYVYVQHEKNQGISVVDVGKPTRPKTIGEIAWPNPSLAGALDLTGNLAIVSQTQIPSMPSTSTKDDLVFWDLTNPTAPRVVQKFSGVVKWFQDERNFIYVLNNDGLWVISQPEEERQAESIIVPPIYE
jgi:hypothetical protein